MVVFGYCKRSHKVLPWYSIGVLGVAIVAFECNNGKLYIGVAISAFGGCCNGSLRVFQSSSLRAKVGAEFLLKLSILAIDEKTIAIAILADCCNTNLLILN